MISNQDNPYIPPEMYLLFPSDKLDFYAETPKAIRRFIFHGYGLEKSITNFEKTKLQQFLKYIESNKHHLPMGILNDPFWTDNWKFRWLSSEQYDFKKTIKAIQNHSEYMKQNRTHPSEQIIKFLKLGLFYVCGRDAHYRPILVFDVEKMLSSKITEDQLIESQKFFFQVILNYYLLPGQLETWVAIIDVGYQNMFSVINPLKKSIGFLSNTFRCRMKVAYLVRCPSSVSFIWSIVKKFMDKDTIDKINFMDSEKIPPLMQYANPSQIEERFGGTKPNMTEYWPTERASEMSPDFSHPNVKKNFISPQQYYQLYQKGQLQDHFINHSLISEISQKFHNKKQQSQQQEKNRKKRMAKIEQEILECLPSEEMPMKIETELPEVITWDSFLLMVKNDR